MLHNVESRCQISTEVHISRCSGMGRAWEEHGKGKGKAKGPLSGRSVRSARATEPGEKCSVDEEAKQKEEGQSPRGHD